MEQLTCSNCGEPRSRENKTGLCWLCAVRRARKTDRDHRPMCGAKKKNGDTCRALAGLGTGHPGIGNCKFHGGSTRNHRKHAERVMVEREVATLGQAIDVTPDQAVTGLLRQAAGMVAALTAKLEDLGELDPGVLAVFNSERDRLARFAKVASDMGIEDRKLHVAEAQTALMSRFVEGVLGRVGLTPEQRREIGPAVRAELATINGTASEVDGDGS